MRAIVDDGSAYLAQVGPAGASKRCSHSRLEDTKPSISQTLKQITKAPREGASFITSQSELGVIRGVGLNWWVFSAIPHLELGKILLPKGLVLGQISVLLGKSLFRRPKEKQASSDAADVGLGVSADAGRMLLMLVVSWPRFACFSSILALGVLQHVCLSMFGEKLVCWVKTCFSPVAVFVWQGVNMLDQNCTY